MQNAKCEPNQNLSNIYSHQFFPLHSEWKFFEYLIWMQKRMAKPMRNFQFNFSVCSLVAWKNTKIEFFVVGSTKYWKMKLFHE